MAYHIYTTDGIILKHTTFGEANLLLYILTADLGLIIASARSARLSSSKLRPALQEYTHILISCVKGKNGWKITNVVPKRNFFFDCPKYSHKVISQIVFLLLKMIQGESPHKKVFEVVRDGLESLETLEKKELESFEILMVLRILYELGYVADNQKVGSFLQNNEWNKTILQKISENKKNLIPIINKALNESQL
jgi:DNA repair protein RecO